MNYLLISAIYNLMKGKNNIICLGFISLLLLSSCGNEVSREEIHSLPKFEAGFYQNALKALNDRIENNPNNADAYFKKGEVLENLDNPDNAIINYKKAIKLDSLNPGYYKGLSRLFVKQEKMARAEENAVKALQLGDQTADLHQLLADIYIRKTEYNIALNHLNKAIETAPRNSEYTYQKGRLYLQLGDTARAKEFLMNNLGRIEPGAEIYESLADIYASEKKFGEAIAYLDSSQRLSNSDYGVLVIKKADILRKSGNISAAKNLLNQYLKEDSSNFAINYKVAELHLISYGYDSALYYLNRTIELDSKSKESFLMMGKVYDRKRMYLTAQEQFKNALLIDTSYQHAKLALRELDNKLAYIYRQRKAEEELNRMPQPQTIKPE